MNSGIEAEQNPDPGMNLQSLAVPQPQRQLQISQTYILPSRGEYANPNFSRPQTTGLYCTYDF
jgi:hypothetical protein